jgi:hypothetical protein
MKEPEEFRKTIDDKFEEAKAKGLSRMDMKWSLWSAEMNRELRTYTEKESPKQVLYKYTFLYWILKSQLLELYYKYGDKFYGKGKIKKKIKEIKEIVKVLDLKVAGSNLTQEEITQMVLKVT